MNEPMNQLLTERRERLKKARVYLILTLDSEDVLPEEALRAALESGAVQVLQLRDTSREEARIQSHVQRLRPLCARHGVLFLLNDHPALAAELDLDGSHVGQDDLPPPAARAALGPARLLGLSTHDAGEIAAARLQPIDYVGLGPCFATASKRLERAPGGAALVASALAAAEGLPVFPIGGIDSTNLGLLVSAGARSAAIGSGILDAADPAEAATCCDALLREAGAGPQA
jgi:thiamine-phosphate pyrophosphorylase